jgi:hypothetical protein
LLRASDRKDNDAVSEKVNFSISIPIRTEEKEKESKYFIYLSFTSRISESIDLPQKKNKKIVFCRLSIRQQIFDIMDFLTIPAIFASDYFSYGTCAIFLVIWAPEILPLKVVSGLCGHPL